MRRVLGYVWRYKYLYLGPILAMFVSVGLICSILTQKIIDQVILGGRHGLLPAALALLLITLGRHSSVISGLSLITREQRLQ